MKVHYLSGDRSDSIPSQPRQLRLVGNLGLTPRKALLLARREKSWWRHMIFPVIFRIPPLLYPQPRQIRLVPSLGANLRDKLLLAQRVCPKTHSRAQPRLQYPFKRDGSQKSCKIEYSINFKFDCLID